MSRRGLSPDLRRPAQRGFTLLEVMVALAILAAGLLAISEVVGGALRNQVRARQLDVATILARGKMVALAAQYERKGFRDFDESEDGTFADEGHPEVSWKVEVKKPTVDLGPDAVLVALSGKKLEDLMPPTDQAPALAPFQALVKASLQALLTRVGEQLKKGLREVRLTVSWKGGGTAVESFDVVTHLVVLESEEK